MKLRFLRKEQETGDIWSFYFEQAEAMAWLAGQSIRLELPKPTWGIDERRFTIASAPYERHIQITTRVGDSSFKQALYNLKENDEINGFNIEGDFVWKDDEKPRLMLAGGIGITPFRSLLTQAAHEKKPLRTTLIYSSKESPALFQQQLDELQRQDPTFYVHYLYGSRFEIQQDSSLASFWLTCNVYVSGPERMVAKISKDLVKQGLPKAQLKSDLFTGL